MEQDGHTGLRGLNRMRIFPPPFSSAPFLLRAVICMPACALACLLPACGFFRGDSIAPPPPRTHLDAVSALRNDVIIYERRLVGLIPKEGFSQTETARGKDYLEMLAKKSEFAVEWRALDAEDVPAALRAGRGDVAIGRVGDGSRLVLREIDCGEGVALLLRAGDPLLESLLLRSQTQHDTDRTDAE